MKNINKLQGKHIIILESSDQGGKSSFSKYLQSNVEGKCHVLHSNYNPNCTKSAHKHQHFLISKFIGKQFNSNYYTNNNVVILDRCYISDIIYSKIGYGSKGTYKQKLKILEKLLKIIRKHNQDVKISLVYCRPENLGSVFDVSKKDELLNKKQNKYICKLYDDFFNSADLHKILIKFNIYLYTYNYVVDPNYERITKKLNKREDKE